MGDQPLQQDLELHRPGTLLGADRLAEGGLGGGRLGDVTQEALLWYPGVKQTPHDTGQLVKSLFLVSAPNVWFCHPHPPNM